MDRSRLLIVIFAALLACDDGTCRNPGARRIDGICECPEGTTYQTLSSAAYGICVPTGLRDGGIADSSVGWDYAPDAAAGNKDPGGSIERFDASGPLEDAVDASSGMVVNDVPRSDPQCASQVAQQFFCDADSDGYAAVGAATVMACTTPEPTPACASWTTRAPRQPDQADCNDKDREYRPDATFGYLPGGGSLDLNCDGRVEKLTGERLSLTAYPGGQLLTICEIRDLNSPSYLAELQKGGCPCYLPVNGDDSPSGTTEFPCSINDASKIRLRRLVDAECTSESHAYSKYFAVQYCR
jgi:hypothetical protein